MQTLHRTRAVPLAVVLSLAFAAAVKGGFAARALQEWIAVLLDVPTAASSADARRLRIVGRHTR
jgi:hypothetical protein